MFDNEDFSLDIQCIHRDKSMHGTLRFVSYLENLVAEKASNRE